MWSYWFILKILVSSVVSVGHISLILLGGHHQGWEPQELEHDPTRSITLSTQDFPLPVAPQFWGLIMIHDAHWATKGIATVYVLSSRIHYLVTSGTNIYFILCPFRFSAFLGGFSMTKGKQIKDHLKVHIKIRWVPWLQPITESTRLPFSKWLLLLRHTSNTTPYGLSKWHCIRSWCRRESKSQPDRFLCI